MSILFRKQGWLTIAQLMRSWGPELSNGGQSGESIEDLGHILLVDILNGRLDDSGPLRDGQRSGLRLITPECKGGIIQGHFVRDLLQTTPRSRAADYIIVMKEAVLDFARRHEIPPPSWWTDSTGISLAADVATKGTHSTAASPIPTPTHSARPRGRKPKKLDRVKEAMREDIRLCRQTPDGLRDMLEKDLAADYSVSRDTARRARAAVLSEKPPEPTARPQGGSGRA